MTLIEQRDIIQAAIDGKKIETVPIYRSDHRWTAIDKDHMFNFYARRYRINPEPREWWIDQACHISPKPIHGFIHVREVIEP